MSSADEFREIFDHIRLRLTTGREWGLEPPRLSPEAIAYLEGRTPSPSASTPSLQPVSSPLPQPPSTPVSTLEQLRELIGDCRRCKLWRGRTKLVFGEGSPAARLVFVGEGPGREEDIDGRPFVGEAGGLLTRIIENGFGLKREEVYICNVVKCRPPGNRKPEPDEINSCYPFLEEQLRLIKPQVICGLGRVAASTLIGRGCNLSRERGSWFSHAGIPLMPTFHPAYILRNPGEERRLKRLVWSDVKEMMKKMGLRSAD